MRIKPGNNDQKGSARYQTLKAPGGGTGRTAKNASSVVSHKAASAGSVSIKKQGSPGRARILFGQPARGMVKGRV